MRIRLDLRYNGTAFFGWAKQPNHRSVQAELETALSKVLPGMWGKPVPTIVGGRTDTGVHAAGQVVHFDYEHPEKLAELGSTTQIQCKTLLFRLRNVLPSDIVVFCAKYVNREFSARFWAKRRTYKYRICDSVKFLNPLRQDVLYYKYELDVRKMNHAVKKFTGVNDFYAFVKPRRGQTSVRNLQYFKFKRVRFGADRGLVVATLKADAFAYNMVRSLIGSSLLVGSGKRPVTWLYECLQSKQRQGATGPTAAKGLTLHKIDYIKSPKRALKRSDVIRARRG